MNHSDKWDLKDSIDREGRLRPGNDGDKLPPPEKTGGLVIDVLKHFRSGEGRRPAMGSYSGIEGVSM